MKKIVILLSLSSIFLILAACVGSSQSGQDKRWSKPQKVMEGCDGAMSNSKQCQKNPNTQQMMIQIDRN